MREDVSEPVGTSDSQHGRTGKRAIVLGVEWQKRLQVRIRSIHAAHPDAGRHACQLHSAYRGLRVQSDNVAVRKQ